MKKALIAAFFLLLPLTTFAQGSRYDSIAFRRLAGGNIMTAPNASIDVCTSTGAGQPCAPHAVIYGDVALTIPLLNPFLSDANGNFGFFAAPGRYVITVTGSGLAPYTLTVTLPCDPSATCTIAGQLSLTVPIGTAPLAVTSTTPVANLTLSNHPLIEYCGATSGATQACTKTLETNPIIVFGDVTLNTATTQSITMLPFTGATSYSCSGSDLTTAAGIVSFNTYAAASVTIQESGGVNTDHLRYLCVGF